MLLRQSRVQRGLAAFVKRYGSLKHKVDREVIVTDYRDEIVPMSVAPVVAGAAQGPISNDATQEIHSFELPEERRLG